MEMSPHLHQAVLEQINDGVYYVDPDRRILYWNHAAERITGYAGAKVTGQLCSANILMHINAAGERLCLGACPLAMTLRDGQVRETQVYLHHSDGHRVPVAVRILPDITDGKVRGAIEIFTENSSLASALARIAELQRDAMLDLLTGIGNRRMAEARLETAEREWQAAKIPYGLLMVDIDHFKKINDRFGHEIGDRALRMVAQSLSNGLRSYDFLGRWGGEEFLAIIENTDLAELALVAERMRLLVESSLIFIDEIDRRLDAAVRVTVSIGGALAEAGEAPAALLARADQHMYLSKQAGRNCVSLAVAETVK